MTTIRTDSIRHLDVRAEAERLGLATVDVERREHPTDSREDAALYVYSMAGLGAVAAASNGDATWDQSPEWADLLAEYGLDSSGQPAEAP